MKNKNMLILLSFPLILGENRLMFEDPPVAPASGTATAPDDDPPGFDVFRKKRVVGEAEQRVERRGIVKSAVSDRVVAGGVVEREDLAKDVENQKEVLNKLLTGMSDLTRISVLRRSGKINADKWDLTSKSGFETIKREWGPTGLGIYQSNRFFETLFGYLSQCSDDSFLGQIQDERVKNIYSNPLANLSELPKYTTKGFSNSIDFFVAIKEVVTKQDVAQMGTEKSKRSKSNLPGLDLVKDAVKSNVNAFTSACSNGDYMTAGVYVAGLYAMYKLYSSSKSKDDIKKALTWGAVLYAGNLLAQNAGYDILEKLGVKNKDQAVKDTPLAALWRVPGVPDIDKIDSNVYNKISFTNFNSLHEQYLNTNKDYPQFIDPALFPQAFPEFAGMSPLTLSRVKREKAGIMGKDNKYEYVGRQLYLLVSAMKFAYEKMVMRGGGKSLADILKDDETWKNAMVFEVMFSIEGYTHGFELDKTVKIDEKFQKRFHEMFEGRHMGEDVDVQPFKPGCYNGRILNFPIVLAVDSATNKYLIFSKADFIERGENPHNTLTLGKLPITGDASNEVDALKGAIGKKYEQLISLFKDGSGQSMDITNFKFDETGEFVGDLVYGAGDLSDSRVRNILGKDADTRPIKVSISSPDGLALEIRKMQGDKSIIVYVKDVSQNANILGEVALSKLASQEARGVVLTDFRLLVWFLPAGRLQYIDDNPDDNIFGIKIAGVSVDGSDIIKIKSDNGVFSFVDQGVEAKILQSVDFAHAFSEAATEDGQFKQTIKNFEKVIDNAPSSYFKHLFKSIPSWGTDATLSHWFRGIKLEQFSGSVPKLYMKAFLNSKKEAAQARFEYAVGKCTTFKDAQAAMGTTIKPSFDAIEHVMQNLNAMNLDKREDGEDWSKEEFNFNALRPLVEAGIENEDYKQWYGSFVDQMFARFGNDNLRERGAIVANKLISIFSFYTAPLAGPNLPAEEQGLRANYANYVADRILFGISQNNGFRNAYPGGPGGYWSTIIDTFDVYKNNPTTAEIVVADTNPVMRGFKSDDYVQIDDFLRANPSAPFPPNAILPRKDCTFQLITKAQYDAFRELMRGDVSNPDIAGTVVAVGTSGVVVRNRLMSFAGESGNSKSEIEKVFYQTMNNALDAVEKNMTKHGFPPKPDGFGKFRSQFSFQYSYSYPKVGDGKYLLTFPITYKFKQNQIVSEVKDVISNFSRVEQSGKTITRGYQERYISDRVASIIKNDLLSPSNRATYFKNTDTTAWEKIKKKGQSIYDWAVGI